MNTSSHDRFDAGLLDLPAAKQAQIITWCDTPKRGKCAGGVAFAKEQLAAEGTEVSLRALEDFCSAWQQRWVVEQGQAAQQTMQAMQPGSANTPREAAEALFIHLALAKHDVTFFNAAVRSLDSRRSLDLAGEKVVTLGSEKEPKAARNPRTRKIAEEPEMSRAEKIAAIRKAFFADVDATVVNLPPRRKDLLPS
jgi:hypothetical protein